MVGSQRYNPKTPKIAHDFVQNGVSFIERSCGDKINPCFIPPVNKQIKKPIKKASKFPRKRFKTLVVRGDVSDKDTKPPVNDQFGLPRDMGSESTRSSL